MEWNVYYDDSNRKKIIKWNIFDHTRFHADVEELLNQDLSKEDLAKKLDMNLMYYFWSKCEYETCISSWIGISESEKIDVYDQVKLNWDKFVDYVWNQKHKNDCNWIPCSERLPEYKEDEYVEYLVSTKNERIYKMPYGYADENDEKPCFHKWDDEMWDCFKPKVIAWMPEPKPYKFKGE